MVTKPGWHTTEFWLSFLPQLIALLVILRIVPVEDADAITSHVTSAVQAVFVVVSSVLGLFVYVRSRTAVKVGETAIEEALTVLKTAEIQERTLRLINTKSD